MNGVYRLCLSSKTFSQTLQKSFPKDLIERNGSGLCNYPVVLLGVIRFQKRKDEKKNNI